MRRFLTIFVLLLIAVAATLAVYWRGLSRVEGQYFVERARYLGEEQVDAVSDDTGEVTEDLLLRADNGLVVHARVRRPEHVGPGRLPVIVIVGGYRTGRAATDLVEDIGGIAFAAIDYPFAGSVDVKGVGDALMIVGDVRQAFLDTPPALILLRRWLCSRPWADGRQIELAGVSLGAPFAAAAGAVDSGYSRIWLVHGALDNLAWAEYALQRHIDSGWLRAITARVLLQLVGGASFDTLGWIRHTAPRPVIAISARGDERVPAAEAAALESARDQGLIELLETDGGHIEPDRAHELGQLLRIVTDRVRSRAARLRSGAEPEAIDACERTADFGRAAISKWNERDLGTDDISRW